MRYSCLNRTSWRLGQEKPKFFSYRIFIAASTWLRRRFTLARPKAGRPPQGLLRGWANERENTLLSRSGKMVSFAGGPILNLPLFEAISSHFPQALPTLDCGLAQSSVQGHLGGVPRESRGTRVGLYRSFRFDGLGRLTTFRPSVCPAQDPLLSYPLFPEKHCEHDSFPPSPIGTCPDICSDACHSGLHHDVAFTCVCPDGRWLLL